MNATASASSTIPSVGYDFLTPLLGWLFGAESLVSGITLGGIFDILGIVWAIIVVLGYLVAFLFLYLYIYASVHKTTLEEIADSRLRAHEQAVKTGKGGGYLSNRLEELRIHIASENPNDWKLAIIVADIILDDTLKQKGYAGVSLGERLRSISPAQMITLDDAWQAHKIRNQIAHGGADFVLTQKLAQETMLRYERVFTEFGIL